MGFVGLHEVTEADERLRGVVDESGERPRDGGGTVVERRRKPVEGTRLDGLPGGETRRVGETPARPVVGEGGASHVEVAADARFGVVVDERGDVETPVEAVVARDVDEPVEERVEAERGAGVHVRADADGRVLGEVTEHGVRDVERVESRLVRVDAVFVREVAGDHRGVTRDAPTARGATARSSDVRALAEAGREPGEVVLADRVETADDDVAGHGAGVGYGDATAH
ncbi:hypothetical protein [Halospeciosus flavus]|uniref:hypothetical protein n=1 Tax=Halospeciosus flavus TaxID=3032283 RepID=UPI00360E1058